MIEQSISTEGVKYDETKLALLALNSLDHPLFLVDDTLKPVFINIAFKVFASVKDLSFNFNDFKVSPKSEKNKLIPMLDYLSIFLNFNENELISKFNYDSKSSVKQGDITLKKINLSDDKYILISLSNIHNVGKSDIIDKLPNILLDYIFDNDSIGVGIIDRDLNLSKFNAKLSEMLQIDLNESVSFYDVTNPYNKDKHTEIINGFFNGYIAKHKEDIRLIGKTGKTIWCSVVFIPVCSENDKTNSLLLLFIDIDETKKQAEEIQRSELEKNIILDALEEQVIYMDLDKKVIWGNRASSKNVNCIKNPNSESMCFQTWNNDKQCESCPNLKVQNTGLPVMQRISSPDGKEWIQQALPVKKDSGELIGIVEVRTDITEIIKAQEQINTSRKILRQVIDLVPHAIYAKNLDGVFLLANEKFASFYNMTPDELVGRNQLDVHPVKSEVKSFFDQDREIIHKGVRLEYIEDVVTADSGAKRSFETSKIPFSILESDEKAVLGVSVDITEKKNLEKSLLHSQKMEAVGRLASGIAHDLNNILTAILGNAELLKYIDLDDITEFNKRLDNIRHAAISAGESTRRLINFGKKQISSPIEFKLNEVINDIYKIAARGLSENITINLNLENNIANLIGDPGQIEQVVMNLIVNAGDAMPNGGIISVSSFETFIDNPTKNVPAGNYAVISVKDTGIGINSKDLDNIFDPFFTTKNEEDNRGLGLSMVYSIVKRHEGFIEVLSEPKLGSQFIVYLPTFTKRIPLIIEDKENYKDYKGIGEYILVLEDDFYVRDAVVQTLKTNGYKAYETARYSEAMETLENSAHLINAAIIDTVLPDKNGMDLADYIYENYPNIFVVIITGQEITSDLENRIKSKNMKLITKPFELSKLLKTIKLAISTI